MKKFRSIASLLLAVVLLFLCVPQVPQVEAVGEKLGDFTGDGVVTEEDVIYLLWNTVDPKNHPLNGWADFTDDGVVTEADVIYLLWHTVSPETYPLG